VFGCSPKIGVPILPHVALRAIATSKLADMPLARRCSRDTARRMDDVNGPNALVGRPRVTPARSAYLLSAEANGITGQHVVVCSDTPL